MKSIWNILEIEETKDTNRITDAYYEKLNKVHPEEDPEGFMALRKAYEEALELSQEEEIEEEIDNSPVGQWLQKVKVVYQSFSKRISVDNWKRLFQEEVCFQLDTSEEVKEKLLVFLMDHFRLPYSIWKMIEEMFHLLEEKEALYEHFPQEFINFVCNAIMYEGLIIYEWFEGEDDADYDEFIRQYYELKNLIDSNTLEKVEETVCSLEELEIYHPYMDVEKARYWEKTGKVKEAQDLLFQLHKNYPKDSYILFFLSVVYRNQDLWDEAYKCYQQLLEENPDHYSARIGVAEYHRAKGEYKKAKEEFLDLLDENLHDEYIRENLIKVNEVLIAQYKEQRETEPDNLDLIMDLAWSLFQNNHAKECSSLLETVTPDEAHLFDYNNLKGRNYLCEENYEQAFIYLSKWIEAMESLSGEEAEHKQKRLAYAYYAKASAYLNIHEKGDLEANSVAMEFLNKAIELEKDLSQKLSYLMLKANLFFQIEKYEDSIDIYEKILSIDDQYYPAYIGRQKSYYELEYYQEVIDNFYQAIAVYPYHAEPYIWAAKVFDEFDKYEDVLDVIKQAEEVKIQSDQLKLYCAEATRNIAKTKEDTEKALAICKEIEENLDLEKTDLRERGNIYKAIALCYMDMKQYEKALKEINKALKINAEKEDYLYIKANISFYLSKYKKALSIYNILDKRLPNNEKIIYKRGLCYENLNKLQKAIQTYKKVLEINPKHYTANHRIVQVYDELIDKMEDKKFFAPALSYATKQLEIEENDYYYVERGLLYLEMDRFEEALVDFEKAISLNQENLYAYNNAGIVFRRQGDYEKAIDYFKKATKLLEYERTPLPYNNLAICYRILQQQEKAIECYKEVLDLFPEKPASYTKIAELFDEMGKLDEALFYYKEGMKLPNAKKYFYLLRIGAVYEHKKEYKKALSYYRKAIKIDPSDESAYDYLAGYYLYPARDYKKAEKYYKKALECSEKRLFYSGYTDYCFGLVKVYLKLNKKKLAEFYFQEVLDLYNGAVGGIEGYITFPGNQIIRIYDIACIYYEMGLFEEAEKYVNRMSDCRKCNNCKYSVCHEMLIGKAKICEWKGEIERAIAYYQQVLETEQHNTICIEALERLQDTNN